MLVVVVVAVEVVVVAVVVVGAVVVVVGTVVVGAVEGVGALVTVDVVVLLELLAITASATTSPMTTAISRAMAHLTPRDMPPDGGGAPGSWGGSGGPI